MPGASVRFHPEAVDEASATYQWYAFQSDHAARGYLSELDRAIERVAIFIENLDRAIDRLHVMVRADITVGIGRQTETPALGRIHAIKSQDRPRHHWRWRYDLLQQRLEPLEPRGIWPGS